MKKYYSTSEYANYAHLHMYILSKSFIERLKKAKLDGEGMYSIKVDIDRNIVTWEIFAGDPRVEFVWNNMLIETDYINKETVKSAAKIIAEKTGKRYEITDTNLLISEIKRIKLTTKKPSVKDNDSFSSPAIRFF